MSDESIDGVEYERKLQAVSYQIRDEVWKAKSKFPVNFHNQHEAYAVILEEVDELWDEIKKNQKVYDLDAQRKEAIQAAAMLCRLLVELL
jgi:NTP pyrophosphatase (non-canonical NTP hydrolase)